MFIETTEIGIFLDDLMNQLSQVKPVDKIEFAQRFFKNLKSGTHVLGAPYSYVLESNHNRRCLIYCFMEAFQGFVDMTVSAIDFFHMIESLSPNFPKSIVMETVEALTDNKIVDDESNATFEFRILSNAVYCRIIYDEWLKLMDEFFQSQKNNPYHHYHTSTAKVKTQVDEFCTSVSLLVKQPPPEMVHAVLRDMEQAVPPIELSAETFRKAIFTSPGIATELYSLAHAAGV